MGKRLNDEQLADVIRKAQNKGLTKHATYFWLRNMGYSVATTRIRTHYDALEASNGTGSLEVPHPVRDRG